MAPFNIFSSNTIGYQYQNSGNIQKESKFQIPTKQPDIT